jgi:hypothetical protein
MGRVHLRRALFLFAIVLGVAALVASLSPPLEERRNDTTPAEPTESAPPSATATPAPEPSTALEFDASKNASKRVRTGQAATVRVAVDEPGSVTIPGLGLTAPANPRTPARFDILASRPGRYEIVFSPAGGTDMEDAGRLVVTSAG